MAEELSLFTGNLEYRNINFTFFFDRSELRLIPPKDKEYMIENEWGWVSIGEGAKTWSGPLEYKGALYRRWYCDSFKRAVKEELTPKIPYEKGKSVEDADNVMKHILARLFEFLYISVYRETTFQEIFNNADPNMFLEAVGITKKDFEILNKYRVFQENVLNNYIHQFFVNESLGSKLNLEDEEVKRQYRNSFDWFGFGLEYEPPKEEDEADESQNEETEAPAAPEQAKSLFDEIVEILKRNPAGLKSADIAKQLNVTKKDINRILYAYINIFDPGDQFFWKLR